MTDQNRPQLDLPDEDRTELPDALRLDLSIAVADARQRVMRAYGMHSQADAWHDVVVALDDTRRARQHLAEQVEEAIFPTVDLGEVTEPPC